MGFDGVLRPRPTGVSVPTGVDGPPWFQREPVPIRHARTYVVARGPKLLRVADADPPSVAGRSASATSSRSRSRRPRP
jgi:hypothetical protein